MGERNVYTGAREVNGWLCYLDSVRVVGLRDALSGSPGGCGRIHITYGVMYQWSRCIAYTDGMGCLATRTLHTLSSRFKSNLLVRRSASVRSYERETLPRQSQRPKQIGRKNRLTLLRCGDLAPLAESPKPVMQLSLSEGRAHVAWVYVVIQIAVRGDRHISQTGGTRGNRKEIMILSVVDSSLPICQMARGRVVISTCKRGLAMGGKDVLSIRSVLIQGRCGRHRDGGTSRIS